MAWPGDWGRKVVITIQDTMFDSGTEDYFPVLLTEDTVPAEMLDTDESYNCQADGGDLRFYTGDYSASDPATENTDRLPCEVVDVTLHATAYKLQVWVRVPQISASADTKITMYYNATGKSQPAEGDSYGKHETWDENSAQNYVAVYHMEDSSGDCMDSTANSNDGTYQGNMPDPIAGKIGNCQDITRADNDYVTIPTSASLNAMDDATIEVWHNTDDLASDNSFWCAAYSGTDRCYLRGDGVGDPDLYRWFNDINDGGQGTNSVACFEDGIWYYLATQLSSTTWTVIQNETQRIQTDDGNDFSDLDDGFDFYLGTGASSSLFVPYGNMDGQLDEVRISNIARSVEWLKACYRNQNAPATYITEGAPVSVSVDIDVTATLDTLILTEYNPTVDAEVSFTAGLDTLTLTEYNSTVKVDANFTTVLDALVLTEYNPTVIAETSLTAGLDALALTEYNPDIVVGISATAGLDTLVLTEYDPTIKLNTDFTADLDTLVLTEYATSIDLGIPVGAGLDALVLTEYNPTVKLNITFTAGIDNLILTENNPTVLVGASFISGIDELTLTEYAATVQADISLTTGLDALTLTEFNTIIGKDVDVTATSQALVLTEYPVAVKVDINFTAGLAELILTEYALRFDVEVYITSIESSTVTRVISFLTSQRMITSMTRKRTIEQLREAA